MLMDLLCPHCGSSAVELFTDDDSWVSDTECITDMTGECHGCGKRFKVSEVKTVTSRIIAIDSEEMDRLIAQEIENERNKV